MATKQSADQAKETTSETPARKLTDGFVYMDSTAKALDIAMATEQNVIFIN